MKTIGQGINRPLTIVCWLWRRTQPGWKRSYTADHVNALAMMLREHLTIPHELVCVTDMPEGIKCRTIPLWDEPSGLNIDSRQPNCYKRLFMFSNDDHIHKTFGPRFVSIDLDCVILKNIDDLFSVEDQFKICEGSVCPYNGSMWMLESGSRKWVWDSFDPVTSPVIAAQQKNKKGGNFYGSDQAWISYCIQAAPTWGSRDGVYHWPTLCAENDGQIVPPNAKIIFFPGKHKPWSGAVRARNYEVSLEYDRKFELGKMNI